MGLNGVESQNKLKGMRDKSWTKRNVNLITQTNHLQYHLLGSALHG
jgi:hypothetical protein